MTGLKIDTLQENNQILNRQDNLKSNDMFVPIYCANTLMNGSMFATKKIFKKSLAVVINFYGASSDCKTLFTEKKDQ